MRRPGRAGAVAGAIALGALLIGWAGDGQASPPQLDYTLNCMGCHRADGAATPGRIPALAGFVARFLSVPGGREFLVQVPGSAQAALADRELAELLNWMLLEFSPGLIPADFRPYTAEEVRPLRSRPLVDVDGVRGRLIEAMAQAG